MKRQILFIMIIIGYFFTGLLPCYCGEKPDLSFIDNRFGHAFESEQMNKLMELKHKRKKGDKKQENDIYIDVYVNCETGKDKPGWGDTPKKPFKTINYAVSRVPFIRDSTDFIVKINIAQGNYEEAVSISYDNIELSGEDMDNTIIFGDENETSIFIHACDHVYIDNLSLQDLDQGDGAFSGIAVAGSNDVNISNVKIENYFYGILTGGPQGGSQIWLSDIILRNNSGYGIWLGGSGGAITGKLIIESSFNGIYIVDNSVLAILLAELSVSNCVMGMYINGTESDCKMIWDSELKFSNNYTAIFIGENTSLEYNAFGTFEENQYGVFVAGLLKLTGGEMTIEANNTGIQIDNRGYLVNRGCVLSIQNNDAGIHGIYDWGGDIKFAGGNTTINGFGTDLYMGFGARGDFGGESTIGTIECDGTVLTSGNHSCP